MKIITITLILLSIFIASSSLSQSNVTPSKWKLGLKLGNNNYQNDNVSFATIGSAVSYQFKTFYFTTGINTEYRFSNRFSLVSGFEYSNRNYVLRTDLTSYKFVTQKSNLIQIPAALRFYALKKKFGIFFQNGLIISYDLSDEINNYIYFSFNIIF